MDGENGQAEESLIIRSVSASDVYTERIKKKEEWSCA